MKIGKSILSFIVFFLIALISYAQTNPNHVRVRGYYRSNGTYVQPHYRTAPNHTNWDNFSTLGNINPYTGQRGWITPDNNQQLELYQGWQTAKKANTNTTCSSLNCNHKSLIYSSGYYYKTAQHCVEHAPQCSNPTCSEPKLIEYSSNKYQQYCDEHEHTCINTNCHKLAVKDQYSYGAQQTYLCTLHSPKCNNPSCIKICQSKS